MAEGEDEGAGVKMVVVTSDRLKCRVIKRAGLTDWNVSH